MEPTGRGRRKPRVLHRVDTQNMLPNGSAVNLGIMEGQKSKSERFMW